MKKSGRFLALLGLATAAYWKYKNATPEEKQAVKDKLNTAKDNLTKLSGDLQNKAKDLSSQMQSKAKDI